MDSDGGAERVAQPAERAPVIGVSMRHQDHAHTRLRLADLVQYLLGVAGSVDEHGVACARADQQVHVVIHRRAAEDVAVEEAVRATRRAAVAPGAWLHGTLLKIWE